MAAIFTVTEGADATSLWVSNGSIDGTFAIKNFKALRYLDLSATLDDGHVFVAEDGTTGYELWITDGTADSTRLLKDINPTGSSSIGGFTPFGNQLLFSA